jgi:hypothetical protein
MTLYKNTLADFNTNFIGFATHYYWQSCLGAIAAMNILKTEQVYQMMQLAVVVIDVCL